MSHLPQKTSLDNQPCSLVVKEEDQEQVLPGLLGHLLPKFQHIQRGDRDWDTSVEHPLPGHLWVNYLQANSSMQRFREPVIF